MIEVKIQVTVDNVSLQYDREIDFRLLSTQHAMNVEKAEEILLDGYHKIKKGLESQK